MMAQLPKFAKAVKQLAKSVLIHFYRDQRNGLCTREYFFSSDLGTY